MANRSYLYASELLPLPGAPIAPIGLSEHAGDVPLVHKLMLGARPERVQSVIWPEHRIGIVGDRKGAAERALAFYEIVMRGDVAQRDDLEAQLVDMKAVLAKTSRARYLILEVAEILDLEGGDAEAGVEAVVAEIEALAQRVDRVLAGKEKAWLAKLRKEDRAQLDLGTWSDVLYFSFPELPPDVLARRLAEAKPRKKPKKARAATKKKVAARTKLEIRGHTRTPPEGLLSLALRDPARVATPVSAYLRDLRDPVTLTTDVRCWDVDEDPPHVLAPARYDVAVLGAREVYWSAPDRDPPAYELNFLLSAIIRIDVSRPNALDRALPANAVTVVIHTPSGQTLMVCPKELAVALDAAVANARRKR